MYLCKRWVWACMRLHRRARALACDWRGPPMRPSLSRARVGTSAGYIPNALVMYEYIYIHIYKPETLNRASPCPSAWTACGFGAQVFAGAKAFNANIGAWNTAAVTTLYAVCAARGPAARTMAGRARPGFGASRPVVRGGTADARARAHTCRHSLCAGPWV
jgi:hypothetical protein